MTINERQNLLNANIWIAPNIFFRESHNIYPCVLKFFISLFVVRLSSFVPIIPVAFNSKLMRWNVNINMVSHDRILWNKRYSVFCKSVLNSSFNAVWFYAIAPITRYCAILPSLFNPRRVNPDCFITTRTLNLLHSISSNIGAFSRTIFRSVPVTHASSFGGFFSTCSAVKNMIATLPFSLILSAKRMFSAAHQRAKSYISVVVFINKIFFFAMIARSSFCWSFSRMIIACVTFCRARFGTEFCLIYSI